MSEQEQVKAPPTQKAAIAVGKRFMCSKCGFEFIVIRSHGGDIRCCGQPVVPKK